MTIPDQWLKWFTNPESDLLRNSVASLIFLAIVVLLRIGLVRLLVYRSSLSHEVRRRWLVTIRNGVIFTIIAGLIVIWSYEISHFALSLAAIAVAIVIALKELLLCFTGSIYRAGANAYSVGDCIEINGMRGDVIDQNMFSTTILELGPGFGTRQYTGRAVILPNALLLNSALISESYMGEFVVHFISIHLSVRDDWRRAEEILLKAGQEVCAPYMEKAQAHMMSLEKKHWIDTPSVKPRVTFYSVEQDKIKLLLRIPAPARRKGRLEQAIMRRFLEEFQFSGAPTDAGKTQRLSDELMLELINVIRHFGFGVANANF